MELLALLSFLWLLINVTLAYPIAGLHASFQIRNTRWALQEAHNKADLIPASPTLRVSVLWACCHHDTAQPPAKQQQSHTKTQEHDGRQGTLWMGGNQHLVCDVLHRHAACCGHVTTCRWGWMVASRPYFSVLSCLCIALCDGDYAAGRRTIAQL